MSNRRPGVESPVALTFAAWDRAADGAAGLSTPSGWARAAWSACCSSSIDYMVCYSAVARLGGISRASTSASVFPG